jgi:ketosteroid isomerase-like protein
VTGETDASAADFFAAIERGDLDAVRELYAAGGRRFRGAFT